MGIVRAEGEGTIEKGHPSVAQWNYALPGADFHLTVNDETVEQADGDFSYVTPGDDHSLVSDAGKLTYYISVSYTHLNVSGCMLTYITDTESGGMFQSETVPPRASTAGQRGDGRRQNKGQTEQHSRRHFPPAAAGPRTLCRPWPESVLVGQTLSKASARPAGRRMHRPVQGERRSR